MWSAAMIIPTSRFLASFPASKLLWYRSRPHHSSGYERTKNNHDCRHGQNGPEDKLFDLITLYVVILPRRKTSGADC
jgi:hypothetical protein